MQLLYRLYERYPNDWYLNLDADIYFKFYIEPQLYGAVRKIFGSFDDWKANKYIVDTHETKHARMGYFQLFNKSNIFYNETYNTAGYSDRYFTSLVTFRLGNKDNRCIAQPGSALALGARGRKFKSCCTDQKSPRSSVG